MGRLTTPLLLLLGLGISACGFHLRGDIRLPPVMAQTYVEAGQFDDLGGELRERLAGTGIKVVGSPLEASAVIRLLGEQRQRRVSAVSSSGAASAYELTYTASFELLDAEGRVLMGSQSLASSRDLSFDGGNVLGKSREEDQIYQALRSEVAAAILQRIQYGMPREAK